MQSTLISCVVASTLTQLNLRTTFARRSSYSTFIREGDRGRLPACLRTSAEQGLSAAKQAATDQLPHALADVIVHGLLLHSPKASLGHFPSLLVLWQRFDMIKQPFDVKLENVGQVLAGLEGYPPNTSLRAVNLEFLRAVSRVLRTIVETPKSERNLGKALDVSLSIHDDVLSQFDRWTNDPREFWHPQAGHVNRYSELSSSTDKAKGFYSSLLKLRGNVAQCQVRWRIGTISAFLDYRKMTSTGEVSKIVKPNIRRWLKTIQWSTEEDEIEKCRQIILAGGRRHKFCKLLGEATPAQNNTECYSAMFLAEATDSWDHKTSINESGMVDMVAELRNRDIHTWTQTPICNGLARKLLQFNENMFLDEARMIKTGEHYQRQKKRKRQSSQPLASEARPRISQNTTAAHPISSPDVGATSVCRPTAATASMTEVEPVPRLNWSGQYDPVRNNSIAAALGNASGMQPPQMSGISIDAAQCLAAQQDTHLSVAQNCGQQACDGLALPGGTDVAICFWDSPVIAFRGGEQESAEGRWGTVSNRAVDQALTGDPMTLDFDLDHGWYNWFHD
ncbi:uncharacterized protein LMH87_007621 [Akanthomyces muscarius]|uniref:Uncharacterized protein n=1 Tax=Akanthomyces muscarius TaxID=2231603 RepID=A0A9W8URH2_AKAMU|nr:uncharacterized protein LMH87_007621 [Akanthomyces muscarius]KAJ4161590.1 hypothetical protein LMH87_007621 [Akanthomyces muscarius]